MATRRATEEISDADFVAGVDQAMEKVMGYLQRLQKSSEVGDVTLDLSYMGKGQDPFAQLDWSPGKGEPFEDVAAEVIDAAVIEGQSIHDGGLRKFTLRVGTPDNVPGQCSFALQFEEQDEAEVDEAPNEKGITSQLMRHQEKVMHKQMELMEMVIKDRKEADREKSQRIRDLEKTITANWEQYVRLTDASHAHALEMRKLEKEETRKDEMAGFLMTSGQIVANKLLGQKVFDKQDSSPVEQTMKAFFSTFTPEQVEEILKTGNIRLANQAQGQSFFHLLQLFLQKAKEEQGGAPAPGEQPQAGPGGQP